MICSVTTRVARLGNCVGRVLMPITTSSSEALPARSPRPLTHTSSWRAPFCSAARVLDVARPRSLWQWTETVAAEPNRSTTRPTRAPNSAGMAYPTVSGMLSVLGTRVDRGLVQLHQEVDVRPSGVLGAEFDLRVRAESLSAVGHPLRGGEQRLVARDSQLVLEVDVAAGDEDVQVRPFCNPKGFHRTLRISVLAAGEPGHRHAPGFAGDRLDRLELAGRGGRKAGLDHVDVEADELAGDLDLLGDREPGPGSLLAVAESRVEDPDRPRGNPKGRRRARGHSPGGDGAGYVCGCVVAHGTRLPGDQPFDLAAACG